MQDMIFFPYQFICLTYDMTAVVPTVFIMTYMDSILKSNISLTNKGCFSFETQLLLFYCTL